MKNVLILAAHPDDEVLGCGATIAKLADQGSAIQLLTFTDGEGARSNNNKYNRNHLLGQVSNILGIQKYGAGNFPDNAMDTISLLEICKFIENSISTQPDIILTHHPRCLNIDHSVV
jgi:LmbE family N-acetylglucosaminyl deacetylase